MALGAAGALLAAMIWAAGGLDKLEHLTWDFRVSLFVEYETPNPDIVLVFLDQSSLDWARDNLGIGWPWPREIYAVIADYCSRSGSRALGFDVLYTEPSAFGVQDDLRFAQALGNFPHTAGTVSLSHHYGKFQSWPDDIIHKKLNLTGIEHLRNLTRAGESAFEHATFPITEIAGSASILCNSAIRPDTDGIYRRIDFLGLFDDRPIPILGLGMYLVHRPDARIRVNRDRIDIDGRSLPIDGKGRVVLRYQGRSGTFRSFSAASVIQSELRLREGQPPTIRDISAFQDKYVIFGFSAPGLFDHHPTPQDSSFPGVEIHATWLDNFLGSRFIKPTPSWFSLAWTFVLCMAAASIVFFLPDPGPGVGITLISLCFPILAGILAYGKDMWIPIALPEIGLALTMAGGFIINYATEGRKKRFIQNAFRQYLSPDVIEQLIQNPDKLQLGGERRELSIFFSDIQGFTSISEKLDPEALTHFLNDYLSAMTDIIHQEGGTIDKYEGDAIIAFWNAPLAVEDHAVRCVRAALTCQKRLEQMRPDLEKRTGSGIFTRIGINTGFAVVGNMGSRSRFDFTMIGDAVNLASRLEGANKGFGTYVMVSETTRSRTADGFAFRTLGKIRVKGRREPVKIFEPFFLEDFRIRKQGLEIFEKGLKRFHEGRFDETIALMTPISDKDPAAAAYIRQCRMLMERPLPENWEGVWELTEK